MGGWSHAMNLKHYLPAFVVLAVGGALSVLAYSVAHDWESDRVARNFEREALNHKTILERRFASTIEVIHSIRGLYAASVEVNRAEFRSFILIELEQRAGDQAMEWIPRVKAEQRAAFEAAARRDGHSDFTITERTAQGQMVRAPRRAEYFPVYFVEPYAGNEAALGFDLASNPARLRALEKARDTGKTVATARITLVQETGDQYGFLVFDPIYRKAVPTGTVEERRDSLQGFALGVLRIGEVIESALREDDEDDSIETIEMFVYDTTAPAGQRLLYPKSAVAENRADIRIAGCVDTPFGIAGRDWLIVHCPIGERWAPERWQSWISLIAGLAVTGTLTIYLLLMIRQRTRTERLAEELRSSEERYRGLFENAHDMIQSVDAEGRFIFANPAWMEAMGYTQDELDGANMFDFISPESKAHCLASFERIMAGESQNNVPVTFVRKDGRLLETEGNMAPQISAGRVVATQSIFRDVTERKRMAMELIQTAKLATLGEMSTGLAHELNQPLNVIRMAADSSLERIEEGAVDAKFLHGKFQRISAQIERAAKIIDHMRIFGRQADERPDNLDPREVVKGALGLIGEQLRLLGIEVETRFPERCPKVSGHAVQLEQVVLNLIGNARDAIEANRQGDGDPRKISLIVEEAGSENTVKLIVEDSGGGIPANLLDRIFEPFFTTKEVGKGTGLGLSISYGIVNDMGGTLKAANLDDGASIAITLPVVDEDAAAD